MLRLIVSPVQLPTVPLGFLQMDDYGNATTPLPTQYHFVDDAVGTDEWLIYDAGGDDAQPLYRLPAGYQWSSSTVQTEWGESTYWTVAPIPEPGSGWARAHHLVELEAKIGAGTPISQTEMNFLEGVNGYGRGSSIPPAGWIAGQRAGNQADVWNDFVARIEDLEAPGDFLGINGLGTPDDWGPTTVILAAVSAGASEYLSGAAELASESELAAQGLEGAGELAEVPALTIAPEAEASTVELVSSAAPIVQAEPIAASSGSTVLEAAPGAPLAESTLPAIPDLAPEDLQAVQDAAGATSSLPSLPNPLPDPAPAPGAVDAPLVSSSAIAPPPPPVPELTMPAIPELPLPEITIAAAGGGALGSLSLPTLTSALTAAKKLLAGGGGASSSAGSSAAAALNRQAITPADFTVDPVTGDTWLRPDDSGTVSQTQFAIVGTMLLALASVFFIK